MTQPVAADRCSMVCLSVCVCVFDISVSPTKMVEPIEMPFGFWTRMGPRNHVLGVVPKSPRRRGSFGGRSSSEMH